MKVYKVKTIGGGHGEHPVRLIGIFAEITAELREDAKSQWWNIEEIPVWNYSREVFNGGDPRCGLKNETNKVD